MTSSTVCVDASIVLNLWLDQPLSAKARDLWQTWNTLRSRLVAPSLFRYEVTAVFRRSVHLGLIAPTEGRDALQDVLQLPIEYISPSRLHLQAYDFATRFNRPTAYDAHYLVIASELDCEFWTADRRLVNTVGESLPWVKWLGDYSPTSA